MNTDPTLLDTRTLVGRHSVEMVRTAPPVTRRSLPADGPGVNEPPANGPVRNADDQEDSDVRVATPRTEG